MRRRFYVQMAELRDGEFRPTTEDECVLVSPWAKRGYRAVYHIPSELEAGQAICGRVGEIQPAIALHPDDLPAEMRLCKVCDNPAAARNPNQLVAKLEGMSPEDVGLSPIGQRSRTAGGAD